MTVDEFRKDPTRVKHMRELLEDETLKEWLHAMRDSSHDSVGVDPDITPHGAHIMYGFAKGYAKFYNLFPLGGVHYAPQSASAEKAALKLKEE